MALGVCLAVGLLIRSDFLVAAVVIVGFLGWSLRADRRVRRIVAAAAGIAFATLVASSLARYWYDGELTPNTYALKVEGWPLPERVYRGAGTLAQTVVGQLWLLLAMAAVALRPRAVKADPRIVLLALIVAAQAAYSVDVGGDAWETWGWEAFVDTNRYLSTVFPLLVVLGALGTAAVARAVAARDRRAITFLNGLVLASIPVAGVIVVLTAEVGVGFPRWPRRVALVVVVLFVGLRLLAGLRGPEGGRPRVLVAGLTVALVVTISGSSLGQWATGTNIRSGVGERNGTALGIALRQSLPAEASTAVIGAGAIAYFSSLPSVDVLGKMDATIATMGPVPGVPDIPGHMTWDYQHSICDLRPEVVVQLFRTTAAELATVRGCGYTLLGAGDRWRAAAPFGVQQMWVRDDSPVDRTALCESVARLVLGGVSPCDPPAP